MEHYRATSAATLSRLKSVQDAGWLLLVILAPLLVNFWGQQPFELPKVLLVRTVVWLLAGLVLVEYALTGRSLRRALRANPLAGPVALLALVLVVTTFTAVNWRLSLWGSAERGQGAITHLTYLLLFLLAADQFRRSFARARRLVAAMVAAGAPLILLSLLQATGWNPFGLASDARSPIFATLGRANFLGAYLAILAPLTLALLLTTRQRRWRLFYGALFASQLLVILLTFARGAWLAAAFSLFLFGLLGWGSRLAGRWRGLAWGTVGLLALSGPLAVLWLGPRLLGSLAGRLAIWQGTLSLVGQRPLLGYGADALGMLFPRVYPPELVYYQGRDFFVDRAHNLFLEWAILAGVPGLLAFSLVLLVFVLVAGRALRRPLPAQRRLLLIAVLAALLGNVANNLVSFDVTPTATAGWLLMGVGVALAAPPPSEAGPGRATGAFRQWLLVGLLFAALGVAAWQMNGRPLLADVAARSSHLHARASNWPAATAAAEQAVSRWPVEPTYHLLLSQAYRRQAAADPAAAPDLMAQAESALATARQIRPGDPAVWLHSAQFYSSARRQQPGDTTQLAHDTYRQAVALAPNHATIYTAWGRLYLEEGDAEMAAPLLRRAVSLDASSGEAYIYLGAAELALGRVEVALADYHEAVRLLPGSARAYAGLARCYWQLERPQQALEAAQAALQLDPHNAQAISLRQAISNAP